MMNIHRLVAIKYEHNGITDADGTPISLAEFEYRKTVALRNYHMNSGIPQLCWGATLATFGFCMMGYSIYAIEETSKNSHWDMGGPITYLFGLIAFGPAIPMLLVGGYKTKRALHLQKQLHSSEPSLGFRPIVAPNVSEQSFHAGISLRVSF